MTQYHTPEGLPAEDWEIEEAFERYLDESFPEVELIGFLYAPSLVLKRVDPVVFDEALDDYIDWMLNEGHLIEEDD